MTVRPPTVQWLAADGVTHRQPGPAAADNGFLDIIDQTCLPRELVRLHLCAPQDIHDAIQRLAVRGAPAIGCAAALGLAAAAQRLPNGTPADFLAQCRRIAAFLAASRPTAVNLEWALNR